MKTLSCEHAEKLIVRDLDEGLNPADRARLEEHLTGCAECCRLREQCRNLFHQLEADVPQDPGEDFWRMYEVSLDAKLREREMRPGGVFPWRVAGALLAAGLIVIAVGLGVFDLEDRTSLNPAVSVAVMEELTELYGPAAEDQHLFMGLGFPDEVISRVSSNGTTYDDVEITWFEVEDERNNLFL